MQLGQDDIAVWIREKNIKLDCPDKPGTIEQLEHILQRVDKFKICRGGPEIVQFEDIYSEAGFKDGSVWRHKKCAIVLDNASVCASCVKLPRNFADTIARNYNKKKAKPRITQLTPRAKKIALGLRKSCKNKARVITHQERIITDLYKELDDKRDKLKTIEESTVLDILKERDTPASQVTSPDETYFFKL